MAIVVKSECRLYLQWILHSQWPAPHICTKFESMLNNIIFFKSVSIWVTYLLNTYKYNVYPGERWNLWGKILTPRTPISIAAELNVIRMDKSRYRESPFSEHVKCFWNTEKLTWHSVKSNKIETNLYLQFSQSQTLPRRLSNIQLSNIFAEWESREWNTRLCHCTGIWYTLYDYRYT